MLRFSFRSLLKAAAPVIVVLAIASTAPALGSSAGFHNVGALLAGHPKAQLAGVTSEGAPPVLDPIGDQFVAWGYSFLIHASASDPDGDALTYSLDPGGVGSISTSGDYEWATSSSDVGNHSITVRVTDDGAPPLDDSETLVLHVTARSTLIDVTGPATARTNGNVIFQATLRDATNGSPLSGATVAFTLGTQSTTAVTNGSGVATATIFITQAPAATTVRAEFEGTALYTGNTDTDSFAILAEVIDTDLDGIYDDVDPQPLVPSTIFDDNAQGQGGSTIGALYPSAGTAITVRDASDPAEGVTITVDGGPGSFLLIQLAAKSAGIALMSPGVFIVTDPPKGATVSVVEGGPAQISVTVGVWTTEVEIEAGGSATIFEVLNDRRTLVDAYVGNIEGTVRVNGETAAVATVDLLQAKLAVGRTSFTVTGTFHAATGTPVPSVEAAVLKVGDYFMAVPPNGSTTVWTKSNNGTYSARGTWGGVQLIIQLRPVKGEWMLKATGTPVDPGGLVTLPATTFVGIRVGDEVANAMVVRR